MNKEIEKTKDLYRQTFNTDSGSKILADLEARCNYKTLSYVAGDVFEHDTRRLARASKSFTY